MNEVRVGRDRAARPIPAVSRREDTLEGAGKGFMCLSRAPQGRGACAKPTCCCLPNPPPLLPSTGSPRQRPAPRGAVQCHDTQGLTTLRPFAAELQRQAAGEALRHCPHALGNARRAQRGQLPPSPVRQDGGVCCCAQRHYHKLQGAEDGSPDQGVRLCVGDRHRVRCRAHQVPVGHPRQGRRGPDLVSQAGRAGDPGAGRRLCPRVQEHPLPERGVPLLLPPSPPSCAFVPPTPLPDLSAASPLLLAPLFCLCRRWLFLLCADNSAPCCSWVTREPHSSWPLGADPPSWSASGLPTRQPVPSTASQSTSRPILPPPSRILTRRALLALTGEKPPTIRLVPVPRISC